jgi:hypothetical protein
MRYWFLELAGWVLLGAGLVAFYGCYLLLTNNQPVEMGPMMVIGFVIFRGGIQLLKVAVAARVCAQFQGRTPADQPKPAAGTTARRARPPVTTSRPL